MTREEAANIINSIKHECDKATECKDCPFYVEDVIIYDRIGYCSVMEVTN